MWLHRELSVLNFTQSEQKEKFSNRAKFIKFNQKNNSISTKYEIFYETSPDLYRTINSQGIIVDCNTSYAKNLGYTKDEVIGMSIFDHISHEYYQRLIEINKTWKKYGIVKNQEIFLKRKDSTTFPVLLSATTFYDEAGEILSSTIIRDITEIYEAKQTLFNQKRKYRQFYENSPDIFCTINIENMLTDCNKAYTTQLGYEKEEVIGKVADYDIADSDKARYNNLICMLKEIGEIRNEQIFFKKKNGEIFPTLLSMINTYDENGKIDGRSEYFTEISQLYNAKQVIEENEKTISFQLKQLQEIDRQKSEFLVMISHELKTPLVPVIGYCELLAEFDDLTEDQKTSIDEIYSSSKRLEKLVEDIFTVQKLDMNKISFNIEKIKTNEFLEKIKKSFDPAVKQNKIDFVITNSDDFLIESDQDKLFQIFSNLIENAIDFVSTGKGIIEIGSIDSDDKVIFFVKDNGMGIPENKIHNLFKKFYQIDTSLSRKHGGSGLGLVICKGIIEGLGGKIWLESKVGKGTTFYFTIPKKK